jgi:hypothetical protein
VRGVAATVYREGVSEASQPPPVELRARVRGVAATVYVPSCRFHGPAPGVSDVFDDVFPQTFHQTFHQTYGVSEASAPLAAAQQPADHRKQDSDNRESRKDLRDRVCDVRPALRTLHCVARDLLPAFPTGD